MCLPEMLWHKLLYIKKRLEIVNLLQTTKTVKPNILLDPKVEEM